MNPDEKNQAIKKCWEKFVKGEKSEFDIIKPFIIKSWKRSRANKVSHEDALTQKISVKELEASVFFNREFLKTADPLLLRLKERVGDSEAVIILSDKRGMILRSHLTGGFKTDVKTIEPGFIQSEELVGTNGVGTCLEEKRPLQILAHEHYNKNNHGFNCSSSPIYSEDDEIIGCITLSTKNDNFHPHTLGMVCSISESITDQLRLKRALEKQRALFELFTEGVVVVDNHNRIRDFNKAAKKILSLPEDAAGTIMSITGSVSEMIDNLQDEEVRIQAGFKTTSCIVSTITPGPGSEIVMSIREKKRMNRIVNQYTGHVAHYRFEDILGNSDEIKKAINLAKAASSSDSTILLNGESGTGKELFAQAIHCASKRSKEPFVAVNCGALPKDLIQSELFGYSPGAYTGAGKLGAPGKFELADGGTIFLDEIGDMPLDAQVNLLRVLQEGVVVRIGSSEVRPVDIRVIAATHRNLEELVLNKSFRLDLYYRLNVVDINIPPLRHRIFDLPVLAQRFLEKSCKRLGKKIESIDESAIKRLSFHNWPGNVRELENIIERSVLIASFEKLYVEDIPELSNIHEENPEKKSEEKSEERKVFLNYEDLDQQDFKLENAAVKTMVKAMEKTGGNVQAAARLLGISRGTLYSRLKSGNISPSDFRS